MTHFTTTIGTPEQFWAPLVYSLAGLAAITGAVLILVPAWPKVRLTGFALALAGATVAASTSWAIGNWALLAAMAGLIGLWLFLLWAWLRQFKPVPPPPLQHGLLR
jgi:hypothetical protein